MPLANHTFLLIILQPRRTLWSCLFMLPRIYGKLLGLFRSFLDDSCRNWPEIYPIFKLPGRTPISLLGKYWKTSLLQHRWAHGNLWDSSEHTVKLCKIKISQFMFRGFLGKMECKTQFLFCNLNNLGRFRPTLIQCLLIWSAIPALLLWALLWHTIFDILGFSHLKLQFTSNTINFQDSRTSLCR